MQSMIPAQSDSVHVVFVVFFISDLA